MDHLTAAKQGAAFSTYMSYMLILIILMTMEDNVYIIFITYILHIPCIINYLIVYTYIHSTNSY